MDNNNKMTDKPSPTMTAAAAHCAHDDIGYDGIFASEEEIGE
jgi:hypothetical protein